MATCVFRSVRRGAVFRALVVVLFFASAAHATEWMAGTGSWSDPTNWDAGVPIAGSHAYINNGGTAQAIGSPEGSPIQVNSLLLGNAYSHDPVPFPQTASGHIELTDVDLHVLTTFMDVDDVTLTTSAAVDVGHISYLGEQFLDAIEAEGSLTVYGGDLITDVSMSVGTISSGHSDVTNSTANGTVFIDGKLTGGGVLPEPSNGTYSSLSIAGISAYRVGNMSGSSATGTVTVAQGIREIGVVGAGGVTLDRDYLGGGVEANGALVVTDGGLIFSPDGGQLTVGWGAGPAAAVHGLIDVTGPIQGYDHIQIGSAARGDETTTVDGRLVVRKSAVVLDVDSESTAVLIGYRYRSTANLNAVFELSPGFVQISNTLDRGLLLGDDGRIVLHLAGDVRANVDNVVTDGVYSAMDVNDATLDGVIQADFDYMPEFGSHSYDLMVGDSSGALALSMEPADFQVLDLPLGFKVDFFGLTEEDFGDGNVDVVRLSVSAVPLRAGDANRDLSFDQLDIVQVQAAGKYLTGQSATWGEGDWNGAPGGNLADPPTGDGVFDQHDIVAALQAGVFLSGPYGAIRSDGQPSDGQTSVAYNAATGELAVDAPTGQALTSINVDSKAGIFTGEAALNLGGSFDNDSDNNIFKATFGSSFASLSFGNVAQPGLSEEFVRNDLDVVGSLAGGGPLGDVDLIYIPVPEAATAVLLWTGLFMLGFLRPPANRA